MKNNNHSNQHRRHCMVVHAYYPLGETRVEREAHALINQGYEVDVICLKLSDEPSKEVINGVSVNRLGVTRHKNSGRFIQMLEYLAFLLLALIKLSELFLKKRYGCIQVHNLPDFLVFSAVIPKLFGSRIILDIHDLMPEFYSASIDRDFQSFPVRLIVLEEKISCRFADHVICVTENARQALIERGVPDKKISIVMNVADSKVFYRLPRDEVPNIGASEFNMVYHGTMTKRYGVDLIIKAIARMRSEIPGIRATLIGGGEFRDELILQTNELKLNDYIYFAPNVMLASALPDILRACDVGIVPNRNDLFTDGLLPTKLMEYTALGIPVIAAKTTTISAYFDDDMVLFFEPGDLDDLCKKILMLFNNTELRKKLIERSIKFNQDYSWEKMAAEYVALIDQLHQI